MNVKKQRKQLGLTQAQFWNRIQVTQSGGSRYENGRPIPGPVKSLLALAYGTEKERQKVARRLGLA